MGRPPKADEANGQRTTWMYDETHQLVNEHRSGTGGFNLTYAYDSVGSSLVKDDAGTLTTSTYDPANQPQTAVVANGRTTFGSTPWATSRSTKPPSAVTTCVWNYESQLTGVLTSDGNRVTMAYNPYFRRTDNWS